jgi:hypothetical protein
MFVRFLTPIRTAAIAALSISGAAYGATTVNVTPANMNGWSFNSFDNNFNPVSTGTYAGTGQMVVGPVGLPPQVTPPVGTGSAHLATNVGAGDGAETIATDNFDGTRLDAITSMSYSTFVTANNGQQFPYIGLAISTDGNPLLSDQSNLAFIDFEPPYQTPATGGASVPNQGATALGTWQTWDAKNGDWDTPGTNGGFNEVEPLLSAYPNAVIANPSAFYPGFAGINLQVGFGGSGDIFDGNVDAFSLGTAAGTTTYNFDPSAVPEPASIGLLGLGTIGLVRRRRA